nr:autotransporter domain-containing protein [Burkholderia gladioli]
MRSGGLTVDTPAELSVGYEHAVGATTKAGVAVTFSNDDVSSSSRNANSDVDGVQTVLYGAWMPKTTAAYVMGEVGFRYWNNNRHRSVTASTYADCADAFQATKNTNVFGKVVGAIARTHGGLRRSG